MKKLLLTFMSAAVVASVAAQPFHLISKDDVNIKVQNPELTGKIINIDLGFSSHSTRVPESTLVGDWTFTVGDYYFEESTQDEFEIPYTAKLQQNGDGDGVGTFNFVLFECMEENLEYNALPMAGIFDEENNVLTFPTGVNFGEFEGYRMVQFVFSFDPKTNQISQLEELNVPYDPETGVLSIPENSVIGWPAFVDGQDENVGWFWMYDLISGVKDGVNAIESLVDDFKGDSVYFNLQGVKVRNPQKGEILIEKRGKTSHKVVF